MSDLQKPSMLSTLKAFHEEEDGIEAVQVVMILGIAAVVLVALWKFFPGIREWVKGFIDRIKGIKEDSGESI